MPIDQCPGSKTFQHVEKDGKYKSRVWEWKGPKKEEEAPPQAAVTNHQEEPETTQKATIPAQDEAARSNVVRMAVDYLQDEFPQKCQWGALVQ